MTNLPFKLQIAKSEISRKIVVDHIVISMGEKPEMWYSDTDSMTDYFHHRSATIKELIEELKTRGGDVVRVTTNYSRYNDPEGKELEQLLKKINKIAKDAGYTNKVKIENRHNEMDGVRHGWVAVEGNLERMFEGVN